MSVIRVFPRRTSFTPQDEFAFVGDPPLLRPIAKEAQVSVTFTWDIAEAERLAKAWGQYYPVSLGGPALNSSCDGFQPGLYIKPGVVFTSRGCNHNCPWCLVPEREGRLHLLEPAPGHLIQDNNFLQTGRAHMSKVFALLRSQNAIEFTGGLEADLVDDWFAEELKGLRIRQVFLACDTEGHLKPLEKAAQKLAYLGRNKLRCYVLLGFNGESMQKGEERLRRIWEIGCLPFPQLYQPPDYWIDYSPEWRHFQRVWCRPAATKAMMRMPMIPATE